MSATERLGVIGLGRMGMAMLRRLQAEGRAAVAAWDRDATRTGQAPQHGAAAATGAAEVVAMADVVITIVNDDAGVLGLYEGAQGLLAAAPPGRLFIEMSTLRPDTVARLAAAAADRGCGLVGAPVMGSVPTVLQGQLLVLAGGAAADVRRAEAVLRPLARRVVHIGPAGRGNAMKLVVNLGMAAYLQALAEGLALGSQHGLPLDLMLEVLGEAPIASPWLKAKLPVLNGGQADTTLDLVSLRKDVLSALAGGAAHGVPMPMAAAIATALSAAVAWGDGGQDLAELPRLYRERMVQRPA